MFGLAPASNAPEACNCPTRSGMAARRPPSLTKRCVVAVAVDPFGAVTTVVIISVAGLYVTLTVKPPPPLVLEYSGIICCYPYTYLSLNKSAIFTQSRPKNLYSVYKSVIILAC